MRSAAVAKIRPTMTVGQSSHRDRSRVTIRLRISTFSRVRHPRWSLVVGQREEAVALAQAAEKLADPNAMASNNRGRRSVAAIGGGDTEGLAGGIVPVPPDSFAKFWTERVTRRGVSCVSLWKVP